MTIGRSGIPGDGPGMLREPTDVVVSPEGTIFVTQGHLKNGPHSRLSKFAADGSFIETFGSTGQGHLQLSAPHSIAMDTAGRLFIADRDNNRIMIWDQDGNYIDQWTQFGRPSGIFFDDHGRIFVADSESDDVQNPGWEMGIRIGEVATGWVTEFILYPWGDPREVAGNGAEFVAVDRDGNIYGGEPRPRRIQKYIKVRP